MEVKAKLNYLRMAPRKVRLVANLIRGKDVTEAERILRFVKKKAKNPLLKLLQSAIANAVNNFKLKKDDLFISKILVDEGPRLKRILPRARGSVHIIQKRSSHIEIILKEKG